MVNTVRPDSDLETVKPSAVCCTLMSIFFGIFLARCPSCTRRDRKVTVTTSAIKVAPTANQRRKRETNRGIYCQFTRRGVRLWAMGVTRDTYQNSDVRFWAISSLEPAFTASTYRSRDNSAGVLRMHPPLY